MKIFTKYALAAALVLPSVFGLGAARSEAAEAVINKNQANGVNVRSEAQLGDNIIGLIDDADEKYEVKDKKDGWFLIDFEGKDAYVSSDLFHLLEDTSVVANTNFRKDPSLDSEVIDVIEEGTEVKARDIAENGFVKVEVDGKEGYIYHNLLKTFRERIELYQANNAQTASANTGSNQSYSAPAQSYSKPAQTYNQPAQTYSEPAQSSGSGNWAKEWIAQRESGGSYTAYNPNGGYYGRYQLNPSLVPYGASPAQQEAAADNYVAQRYGSWENAQAFWQSNGWY